jgi:hypothetical protein
MRLIHHQNHSKGRCQKAVAQSKYRPRCNHAVIGDMLQKQTEDATVIEDTCYTAAHSSLLDFLFLSFPPLPKQPLLKLQLSK